MMRSMRDLFANKTRLKKDHDAQAMENIKRRDELKKYFEKGDRPTEAQFSELIDSYVHLNEFNFGVSVKPSGETFANNYDFYIAKDVMNSGAGHKIIQSQEGEPAKEIEKYFHVLSRKVLYKKLDIEIIGNIDIEKHQPKIIIKRYKQRRKLKSGFLKTAGFYQENPWDAESWNRKSEYYVKSKEMILDIEPIHYFKPNSDNYKEFSPSGTINRPGSFKYSIHKKTFLPIQIELEIMINEVAYRSKPVNLKIILGSSGENDAINYILD